MAFFPGWDLYLLLIPRRERAIVGNYASTTQTVLGEGFFICWITLYQLKFFRLVIAKKIYMDPILNFT